MKGITLPKKAMRFLFAALFGFCLGTGAEAAATKEGCAYTWDKGHYKTFKQVRHEVHSKFGSVKIIRMALCGSGEEHYFRVTVLHPSGTVDNVHIAANRN